MKLSPFCQTLLAAATIAISSIPAQATLVDYNLGGNQVDLLAPNLALGGGLTWTNANRTAVIGSGQIDVKAPGYAASMGLYSWQGDYGITLSNDFTASLLGDVKSVIFQIDIVRNPDFPDVQNYVIPTLNFNGGSQSVAFNFGGQVADWATQSSPMGDVTAAVFAWQWDLSGFSEEITSISVTTDLIVHASTFSAGLSAADAIHHNAQIAVIPEPSTYALLALSAVGLRYLRRQRKVA